MSKFSKKKKFLLITAALVLTGGVAAAYWTSGGSGTGTAATGTSANIVVNQATVVTGMGPGVADQELTGNFTNSTGGTVYVTSVTASISSVVKAGGAPAGACTAADYTLSDPVSTVGQEITSGAANGSWAGPSIQFNNTGSNQDGCKLATVNLAYVIA